MAELKYNKDMYEFLKKYFENIYFMLHKDGNRYGGFWGEDADVIETVLKNHNLTHEKFEQAYDSEFDYRMIAHEIYDMYCRLHDVSYDEDERKWYSESRSGFRIDIACYRRNDESFDTNAFKEYYYAGGYK